MEATAGCDIGYHSGLSAEVARCHYVFMALSLNFTRRVRLFNRGSSVTFTCSCKQSHSYKYDFLGWKILICFQDCFPTLSLLKIARDISIYPEIGSGHLGIHCLLSPDHTIALSWKFPVWNHTGWPEASAIEILLPMKTVLLSSDQMAQGSVPWPHTSHPQEVRDKLSLWSWTLESSVLEPFCCLIYLLPW